MHFALVPHSAFGQLTQGLPQKVGNVEDDVSKAEDSDAEEDDIETQIRKEMEGLKPKAGDKRLFQEIKMDMPCSALNLLRTKSLMAIRSD